MATLKELKAEAAKHSAELVINRDCGEVEAWLPEGMEWDSSQAQCVIVSYGYTGKGVMPSVYSDMIEHMDGGSRTA